MSELSFFMTQDDLRAFIAFLIDTFEAKFALDQCPDPSPPVYVSVSSVMEIVETSAVRPRFFVSSRLWERYPLTTSEVHTQDGRHFFAIDQRYGGPAFDFQCAGVVGDEERANALPGWFTDYPWYIVDKSFRTDPSNYRTFDRPPEMTKAFRCVQRYFRLHARRSRKASSGRPGPWAFASVQQQYSRGALHLWGDSDLII